MSRFTADEQLGAAKKKIYDCFRSLSTFVHKGHLTIIVLPFKLIPGYLSTVKDGVQTDVNLQHEFLLD